MEKYCCISIGNSASRCFWFCALLSWILLGVLFTEVESSSHGERVRKTGEYGRRIRTKVMSDPLEHYAADLSPPREDRKYQNAPPEPRNGQRKKSRQRSVPENFAGASPDALEIPKPSLNLELPHHSEYYNFVPDQDALETNPDGYVYPVPAPGVRTTTEPSEETTAPLQPLDPQSPLVRVGDGGSIGLQSKSETNIDSSNLRPLPTSKPDVRAIESDLQNEATGCSGGQDGSGCSLTYEGVIPGEAGKDYPVLSDIIKTDFSCDAHPFSGYYADVDPRARCQIFHICLKRNRNRKTQQWSFLCPNGTVFSQEDFVCVWWANAPECSDSAVRSLYNLNEQLGWDNVTASNAQGQQNGELQGAMSAVSSNTATIQKKKTNSIPYRIPVKVHDDSTGKAKTKLQEVPQNVLHTEDNDDYYDEHDGEETRTQTASQSYPHNLHTESSDNVQPLIVNRHRPSLAPTEMPSNETGDLFMMPTLQRFPDGSEGYGEVPVMMRHHEDGSYSHDHQDPAGYSYPKPEGRLPGAYLPPNDDVSTTTEYFRPPTIPTEPPIPANYENYDQYDGSTTEQTDENSLYYQEPSNEDQQGYQYPTPDSNQALTNDNAVTTERYEQNDDEGYQYNPPTTTQRSLKYRTESPTTEVVTASTQSPYEDSASESQGLDSNFNSQLETTTAVNDYTQIQPGAGTTENFEEPFSSTRAPVFDTTTIKADPNYSKQIEMPPGKYLPPLNKEPGKKDAEVSEEVEYEDDEEGNEDYGSSANGIENNKGIITPQLPASGDLTENILESDEKLAEILSQVQNGGIEAVDGNGNPIEFSRLKELLLNSPKGSIELQGALDSVSSSTTQAPQASDVLRKPQFVTSLSGTSVQERPSNYDSTRSTTALSANFTSNYFLSSSLQSSQLSQNSNGIQSPSGFYLPPNGDNGGLTREPVGSQNANFVSQPSYEIRLPSREYESHSVLGDSKTGESDDSQLQQLARLNSLAQLKNSQSIPDRKLRVPDPSILQDVEVIGSDTPRYEYQQQNQFPVYNAPQSEYLPPRQATSSIVQPQYYQIPQQTQPIQLTENIQLQQSIVLPTHSSSIASNLQSGQVDPKDIKIFPAVFVHHHSSVTSQAGGGDQSVNRLNDNEDSFQNLETAQSTYYAPVSSSLAQQLHQISATSRDQSSSRPRQFFRRSNNGSEPSSGQLSTGDVAHEVTSFTLEDARSTEELQKYHHQDLKRFHTENIAKQGGVLDNVSITRGSSSKPRLSPVLVHESQSQPKRSERKETGNVTRFSIAARNTTTNYSPPVERDKSFKDVQTSQRNQDYFIPISGSYGGSSQSGSESTGSITRSRSREISGDKEFLSQFRVSGSSSRDRSGAGPSGSRRSIDIVESESILLSSFLPETEGGFGSKLVI